MPTKRTVKTLPVTRTKKTLDEVRSTTRTYAVKDARTGKMLKEKIVVNVYHADDIEVPTFLTRKVAKDYTPYLILAGLAIIFIFAAFHGLLSGEQYIR